MKLFYPILLMLCLAGIVTAQTAAPPPPPPVALGQGAKFESAEGGFKIDFPVKPVRQSRQLPSDFGETTVVNFQAETRASVHVVAFTDLPALLKEKEEIGFQFDQMKMRFLAMKNSKLLSEREYETGGNPSREYVFEGESLTVFTKGILVKQRIFQITLINAGIFSSLSAKAKNLLEAKAKKFFDSFQVTKIPEFEDKSVSLPKDFGVAIEDNIFSSAHLKFEMELPEEWHFIEETESGAINKVIRQEAESAGFKKMQNLDYSLKNTAILIILSNQPIGEKNNGATFTIAAERVIFPNFLPEAVIKSFEKTMLEEYEKITIPVSKTKLGNADFAWLEYYNSKDKTKERLYVTNVGGLALEFFLVYKDEAELALMLDSLNSIQFFK